MEPQVDAISTRKGHLHFRVSGINVSFANALRRVIIAEIPCVVLDAERDDQIVIERNTSRLNNELVRQRLSCVPVHTADLEIGDHEVELDVENKSDAVLMVTTRSFRVKNKTTDTYLTEKAVRSMFPPDPVTGDFINLVRLRPLQSRGGHEGIRLRCKLSVAVASQSSAFSVASTCSYAATQDVAASDAAWAARTADGTGDSDAAGGKADWDLLGAKRYVIPNSFDFVVETVGQMTNEQLVVRACEVMIEKLNRFGALESGHVSVAPSPGTLTNAYTASMRGEGYTLGKVIESAIFLDHAQGQPGSDGTVVYCGFRKPHPHVDTSELRVAFKAAASEESMRGTLASAARRASSAFERLAEAFSGALGAG